MQKSLVTCANLHNLVKPEFESSSNWYHSPTLNIMLYFPSCDLYQVLRGLRITSYLSYLQFPLEFSVVKQSTLIWVWKSRLERPSLLWGLLCLIFCYKPFPAHFFFEPYGFDLPPFPESLTHMYNFESSHCYPHHWGIFFIVHNWNESLPLPPKIFFYSATGYIRFLRIKSKFRAVSLLRKFIYVCNVPK